MSEDNEVEFKFVLKKDGKWIFEFKNNNKIEQCNATGMDNRFGYLFNIYLDRFRDKEQMDFPILIEYSCFNKHRIVKWKDKDVLVQIYDEVSFEEFIRQLIDIGFENIRDINIYEISNKGRDFLGKKAQIEKQRIETEKLVAKECWKDKNII